MVTTEVGREARVVVTTALMRALAQGAQAVADLGEESRRASAGLVDLERLVDLIQAFEGVGKALDEVVQEVEATVDGIESVDVPAGPGSEGHDPREMPVLGEVPVGGPFGLAAWYAGGAGPGSWVVEAVTRRADAGGSAWWVTAPESWRPIDLDGQPWVVVRFGPEVESEIADVEAGQVLLPTATHGAALIEHVVEVLDGSDEDSVGRARAELGLETSSARAAGSSEGVG